MSYGAVLLGSAGNHIYDEDSQAWINAKFQRIAEVINDFDPTLHLGWIAPANRAPDEPKPYAILHTPLGGEPYPIFFLDEEDLNEKLIGTLFEARRNAQNLNEILDAHEAAAKALQMKETIEMQEEEYEKARFLLNNKKHTINLGGGKVLRT